MSIANYQALLFKYDFLTWDKMSNFLDMLPPGSRAELKEIITEGQLMANYSLQATLDVLAELLDE